MITRGIIVFTMSPVQSASQVVQKAHPAPPGSAVLERIVRPSSADLVISGCTAQHRGDRQEQQDRVALLGGALAPRCALGVLADGMGGMSGGALAADNVVEATRRRFEVFHPETETPDVFFGTLVDEVHTVLRLAAVTSELEPHSTFAAVLVQPGRVDWCHVGDSRVYHFRDGRIEHCTRDDTYAARLVDEGRLPDHRARLHPSAHCLVNAIGSARAPVPTLGTLRLPRAGDSFLLCSDGLWAHVRPIELAEIVSAHPPREAAAQLIELARARAGGRGDNCSLVLLKLSA